MTSYQASALETRKQTEPIPSGRHTCRCAACADRLVAMAIPVLTFLNTGRATVVFHARSGNPADPVRYYTVEPGKTLVEGPFVAEAVKVTVEETYVVVTV